jgi:hypothetical protein
METANADYDAVWKQALVRYIADFTEFFLRETWQGAPVPASYDNELARCSRNGRLGARRVDKLLDAVGPDGKPCLWHIEVQVARQRDFGERMFVCHYRLYDHFRLPVRSIAILGDPSPTWRPKRFDLAMGGTELSFAFETFKLRDLDDRLAEVLLSDNVFAWLAVAHLLTLRTRREPKFRMHVKNSLLTGIRSCAWDRKKLCDVFDLINRMMRLPKALQDLVDEEQKLFEGGAEMAWKYLWEERAEERGLQRGMAAGWERGLQEGRQKGWEEGQHEGRQEGRQEGRHEGRQEGRLDAMRDMLCAQLGRRFGQPDEAVQRRIASASFEELERWLLALVTARSIDEVF